MRNPRRRPWASLDRNALREVAGLVDLAAAFACEVIGEDLERDDRGDRGDEAGAFRDAYDLVGELVAAVVVAGVILLVLRRRRKKKEKR